MLYGRTQLVCVLTLCLLAAPNVFAKSHHGHAKHHHRSFKKKAAWAGAGVVVGRVAGPPGSLAVGAVKHRHALKAGGHARNKALVKIGAPVAAGAAFGPAGSAAYAGYAHRRWIKHHLLPHHHHHRYHRKS